MSYQRKIFFFLLKIAGLVVFVLSAIIFMGISTNALAPQFEKMHLNKDVMLNIFFVLSTFFGIFALSLYVHILRKIFPDFMPIKKQIKLLKK